MDWKKIKTSLSPNLLDQIQRLLPHLPHMNLILGTRQKQTCSWLSELRLMKAWALVIWLVYKVHLYPMLCLISEWTISHKNKKPTKTCRLYFILQAGLIHLHRKCACNIIKLSLFCHLSSTALNCPRLEGCCMIYHTIYWQELKQQYFDPFFWIATVLRFKGRHVSLNRFFCGWGFNWSKCRLKPGPQVQSLKSWLRH